MAENGIRKTEGVPAVILAGGLATRMGGGDKGLRELGGRSILAHVIARLEPQAGRMAINANGDPERFAEYGLPVIADSMLGSEGELRAGPLAGVLAALDWAGALGARQVVTVAADTPFFPGDLVDRFAQLAEETGARIVLAATPDPQRGRVRHPTFGLWDTSLREDLRAALDEGVRKVVQWTSRHPGAEAMFGIDDGDPFFNVNTPEDLAAAQARAGLEGERVG